jgi:prolyl-tRNA synthetase
MLKKHNPILDDREEYSSGWKFNDWELRGIPIRVEIGPKDLEKNQCVVVRRDTAEKHFVPISALTEEIKKTLDSMQQDMFDKAKKRVMTSIVSVDEWSVLEKEIANQRLVLAPHCARHDCEAEIKEVTKGVTTRCIPLKSEKPAATTKCVRCGQKAKYFVYFARAY